MIKEGRRYRLNKFEEGSYREAVSYINLILQHSVKLWYSPYISTARHSFLDPSPQIMYVGIIHLNHIRPKAISSLSHDLT